MEKDVLDVSLLFMLITIMNSAPTNLPLSCLEFYFVNTDLMISVIYSKINALSFP